MEMLNEMIWESQDSAKLCIDGHRTAFGDDLANLFDEKDNVSNNLKVSGFDFSARPSALEDLTWDVHEFEWLDQKVDLQLFDEALQGNLLDDSASLAEVLPALSEPTPEKTVGTDGISSPSPTIEDLGSYPSSPEQFVPSSQNVSVTPPESPANVQVQFFVSDIELPVTTFQDIPTSLVSTDNVSAEEILISLMQPGSPVQKIEVQPEINVLNTTSSDSEDSAALELDNPKHCSKFDLKMSDKSKSIKRKTPKRVQRQVRFLEPSERKQRKKGQNKTAATRYRQKKRVEFDTLHNEKMDLEAVNEELHSKVNQISSEILYLKSLLREAFMAKGLLKPAQIKS